MENCEKPSLNSHSNEYDRFNCLSFSFINPFIPNNWFFIPSRSLYSFIRSTYNHCFMCNVMFYFILIFNIRLYSYSLDSLFKRFYTGKNNNWWENTRLIFINLNKIAINKNTQGCTIKKTLNIWTTSATNAANYIWG